jgi:hypothetical protein
LPGLQPQQRAHRNAGGGGKVGEGEIALLAERAQARPNSRSRFGQPTSTGGDLADHARQQCASAQTLRTAVPAPPSASASAADGIANLVAEADPALELRKSIEGGTKLAQTAHGTKEPR